MKTIKPNSDYLFCEKVEREKTTKSGLILAVNDKTGIIPSFAKIINLGDNVRSMNQHDEIVYKEFAASEIELDNKEYVLIHQDDVIGRVLEVEE